MPLLSCFSPFGMLEFSSDAPEGQKVYESMVAGYTDAKTGRPTIDLSVGTHAEAKLYATAMAIAAARITVRRADNQRDPATAYDMLPAHERAYSVTPSSKDTIAVRRANVVARRQVNRGARFESVVDGLSLILGANFIKYRPLNAGERTLWPTMPANGPGVFGRPELPAKLIQLTTPVVVTGSPSTVRYANWDPTTTLINLVKGDVLCVQQENLGLAEKVTLSAVAGLGATRTLTATFTKSHDLGASATTGPAPIWASTKRHSLIVVRAVAAIDVSLRRRVDDFMLRVVRGVSTWAIVQPTTPGAATVGPFTLGTSPLGVTPIGQLTY